MEVRSLDDTRELAHFRSRYKPAHVVWTLSDKFVWASSRSRATGIMGNHLVTPLFVETVQILASLGCFLRTERALDHDRRRAPNGPEGQMFLACCDLSILVQWQNGWCMSAIACEMLHQLWAEWVYQTRWPVPKLLPAGVETLNVYGEWRGFTFRSLWFLDEAENEEGFTRLPCVRQEA